MIHTLVFHHSAAWRTVQTREKKTLRLPTVEEIREAHLAKGWRTAGYHCIVDRGGVRHYFRKLGENPAAQKGKNPGTYAVCLIGWNGPTSPDGSFSWTRLQLVEAREMIKAIRLLDPTVKVLGHRDLTATECPGLDVQSTFKQTISAYS